MVKLLIVDDDLPTSDYLQNFFSKRDYEVFVANEGKSALAIVKEKRPSIVLLDIRMPGPSGIKVLQQIKEIDKNIKVIMMTGVDEKVVMDLAKESGAADYITKPFSLENLENNVIPKILKQLL
ncbi:MAG: response regulator [Candidatus Gorgyraea atricola]|nr:response regulator [Candidatus Gorgyraea atricola]